MKSKFIAVLVLVAVSCGAVLMNGCGNSSTISLKKFTIYGSGQ